MNARELVMAIMCRPLSGKELLQTEKANNVIIHRRIEFDGTNTKQAVESFLAGLKRFPIKLMFIFGFGDSIVVHHPEDFNEVTRRLMAL
jgi:hypothetical protein